MINLTDLIFIHKRLLSDEECDRIIEEYESSPSEEVNECCPHAFSGENIYSPNTVKYKAGQWIHPHTDHDLNVYGSCTINLNDDYDGGLFSFWGGKHKVELKRGDCMIWPADFLWVHEVEEITKGTRYSVNCFLRNKPQHLPKTVSYHIDTDSKLMEDRLNYFKKNQEAIDAIKYKQR